jgi:hypothetical protein
MIELGLAARRRAAVDRDYRSDRLVAVEGRLNGIW